MLTMKKTAVVLTTFLMLASCAKKDVTVPTASVTPLPEPTASSDPVSDPAETPAGEQGKDDIAMNVPDLTSLDSITLIVNKQRGLPEDYVPENLVTPDVPLAKSSITMTQTAAEAMKEMFDAAKEDGISLMIGSGYRSYDYQKNLYNRYVERDGEAEANRYSAKPGMSEHQTGLAADLSGTDSSCYLKGCFKDTEEGQWLKANAWKYGFILRYPEGKEEITGYIFEPWHYRYFGTEEAKKIFDSGLTVEEYYQLLD